MLSRKIDQLVQIIGGSSRTYTTGVVDTSSAPEKASLNTRTISEGQFRDAILEAATLLDQTELTTFDVGLLSRTNELLVSPSGIRSGLRNFDVAKFGYIDYRLINDNMNAFIGRIQTLPGSMIASELIDVLFDIHWSINIRGHYFQDGCGRTAALVGCWISDRYMGELVLNPGKGNYRALAQADDPLILWRQLTNRAHDPDASGVDSAS